MIRDMKMKNHMQRSNPAKTQTYNTGRLLVVTSYRVAATLLDPGPNCLNTFNVGYYRTTAFNTSMSRHAKLLNIWTGSKKKKMLSILFVSLQALHCLFNAVVFQ